MFTAWPRPSSILLVVTVGSVSIVPASSSVRESSSPTAGNVSLSVKLSTSFQVSISMKLSVPLRLWIESEANKSSNLGRSLNRFLNTVGLSRRCLVNRFVGWLSSLADLAGLLDVLLKRPITSKRLFEIIFGLLIGSLYGTIIRGDIEFRVDIVIGRDIRIWEVEEVAVGFRVCSERRRLIRKSTLGTTPKKVMRWVRLSWLQPSTRSLRGKTAPHWLFSWMQLGHLTHSQGFHEERRWSTPLMVITPTQCSWKSVSRFEIGVLPMRSRLPRIIKPGAERNIVFGRCILPAVWTGLSSFSPSSWGSWAQDNCRSRRRLYPCLSGPREDEWTAIELVTKEFNSWGTQWRNWIAKIAIERRIWSLLGDPHWGKFTRLLPYLQWGRL